ncbi:MAG: NUDIX domain-containing protein [Nitrososphaerales archaeon]|jgi:isopentenyl-diphosphate delta-isomerase
MPINSEMIYTVDELGNLLNLESRENLHLTKSSKRHAAVIGMILRNDGKLLVQWRAPNKLGGNRLDVSATTHVRKGETYENALQRSFDNELKVKTRIPLMHAFDFRYEEDLGDHKENEFCKVYFGKYDGKYEPNPDEIDSVEFMSLEELQKFVSEKSEKATKWLRETVKRITTSMLSAR